MGLGLGGELVDGYAQVRRAGPSRESFEKSPVNMKRDLPGMGGDGGIFRDASDKRKLVHILESVAVSQLRAAHAAHRQNRAPGGIRGGYPSDGIGMAGRAGDQRDTRRAGHAPQPSAM